MKRAKLEKYLGKEITVIFRDGDVRYGRLYKADDEAFSTLGFGDMKGKYIMASPENPLDGGITMFRLCDVKFIAEVAR